MRLHLRLGLRLRLVHKLSLLMLSFALLAVVALGGFSAWNLRHGFGQYLAARDVVHLEQFVSVLEAALQDTGPEALATGALSMRRLLNEVHGIPNDAPAPAKRLAPPPGGFDALPLRLSVVSLNGQTWLGRPLTQGAAIERRPVHYQGAVVAWVLLAPAKGIPHNESRFLHAQYLGIALISAVLLVLAVVSALWHSRRWVRPLLAVQSATQQLASGQLAARIPTRHTDAAQGDEVDDVLRNINQMAESLQRLDTARRRWLADISHELRTPLTVLQGGLEAICDGVRPLQRETVLALREEVLLLGKIVNDLHFLAMADVHPLRCQFASFDATVCVTQWVQRFAARAQERGLALVCTPPEGVGPVVCWDADRMQQVVANVLENSLRYTDAPGHIGVRWWAAAEQLHVVISDSSPGVPSAELAPIFEPLYRCDPSRTRAYGGSGLGLSICQTIVQAHGGRIHASPSDRGGLQINIMLPLVPPVFLVPGQAL